MRTNGDRAHGRSAIALLTGFGRDSFYVGAMKGAMLARDTSAGRVDTWTILEIS